jgi:hypothetical protein
MSPAEQAARELWWGIASKNITQAVMLVAERARAEGFADGVGTAEQVAKAAGAAPVVMISLGRIERLRTPDPVVAANESPEPDDPEPACA